MAQAYVGQKRIRRYFGKIREVLEMPNLIEVQKSSYDLFLRSGDSDHPLEGEGIQGTFQSVFPIKDFNETAVLEFVKYELEKPKYDVDECQQRDMTYAAPLKVTLRLIVFDVDETTGARSVKDIKEQDVYMGDMPLMTHNGTFVVNGTERVIVSQMHRSPGVFFDHDKGKTHSSGKLLFACRIIPYRGSWLDFEFDAKDIVFARIDRRRKLPVTTLLYALGMDQEGIMDAYYETVNFSYLKNKGWVTKFFPERVRGTRPTYDIVDAATGEVICKAGDKMTPRMANELIKTGKVTELLLPYDHIVGRYVAKDIINEETGEIWVEAGDELTMEYDRDGEPKGGSLKVLLDQGITDIPVLDIDNVNVGPYLRNTMAADKNMGRDTALMDIYRVMRPGEPPTVEAASQLFDTLFFDSERYDLSAVGRVKMNMRLDLGRPDTQRTLDRADIVACIKALTELRDGKGEIDDIDHLGNRRVRSVGELMENQYRVGLLRMERAIKERMSSVEIDTIMPQDLINAKPAAAAVREFFGSSQLSQFMDQTNPLSEVTHKRRLSALGPGGLTRERAGFEVRDVHPTHYGRMCPIETPEGQNIGLINSLATFARVNKYGFIETPYRKVIDNKVTDEVIYMSATEEMRHTVAQANASLDAEGRFTSDLISSRKAGDFMLNPPEAIDLIDVSPKQLVSVAASRLHPRKRRDGGAGPPAQQVQGRPHLVTELAPLSARLRAHEPARHRQSDACRPRARGPALLSHRRRQDRGLPGARGLHAPLRRLTNPGLASVGVSVLMRYTLRLLTLDQLQRAATLICALELLRQDKANQDLGPWPFEIGLWVGRAATPNKLGKAGDGDENSARKRVLDYQGDTKKPLPIPLETCPWCGAGFTPASFQLVPSADAPIDLRVVCTNRSTDANACAFSGRPLPMLTVDEPIYRRLPCFLIATVDKFAALPWEARAGALFGKVERHDAQGFYGAADEGQGKRLPQVVLPPDLIIQDELHLISGPLGTISGLYEAAIEHLASRELQGRIVRPKIVASTATVRRAQAQIRELFARNSVEIFPPPGPHRRDSFFARTVSPDKLPARKYLGVAAPGRSLKVV